MGWPKGKPRGPRTARATTVEKSPKTARKTTNEKPARKARAKPVEKVAETPTPEVEEPEETPAQRRGKMVLIPGYARSDLNGHRAIDANICMQCGGPLRGADGTFSEKMVDYARMAYAAAVCAACKLTKAS